MAKYTRNQETIEAMQVPQLGSPEMKEFHEWTNLHGISYSDPLPHSSYLKISRGLDYELTALPGDYIAIPPDSTVHDIRIIFEGDFNRNYQTMMTTTVNDRVIVYGEEITHITRHVFPLWTRIKILLGFKLEIESIIYATNPTMTVDSKVKSQRFSKRFKFKFLEKFTPGGEMMISTEHIGES